VHVFILDNVGNVDILVLDLHCPVFSRLRIIQRQGEGGCSHSLIEGQLLSMHQLGVGVAAADVVDELRSGCVEVGIFILIVLSELLGRVIDVPDVDSSELKLLL
jgi:hypothetical protein